MCWSLNQHCGRQIVDEAVSQQWSGREREISKHPNYCGHKFLQSKNGNWKQLRNYTCATRIKTIERQCDSRQACRIVAENFFFSNSVLICFVLTLLFWRHWINVGSDPYWKGSIIGKYIKPRPPPPQRWGCSSNYLGPVWANMYSDPFSSTTPAAAGIDNLGCVK